MSYYQRHREELLARQHAYHRENREKQLAYMRQYNAYYYATHKPEPKPRQTQPKEEKLKTPKQKSPKTPKIVKPKNLQDLQTVPTYPTIISRGNFTLSFD